MIYEQRQFYFFFSNLHTFYFLFFYCTGQEDFQLKAVVRGDILALYQILVGKL